MFVCVCVCVQTAMWKTGEGKKGRQGGSRSLGGYGVGRVAFLPCTIRRMEHVSWVRLQEIKKSNARFK